MPDDVIAINVDRIREIAGRHGARRLRVFGSRAKGSAHEASDLDLLVDFESGRDLLDLISLKQELEMLLGCVVDVVTEAGLSPHLRESVLRDAKTL